MLLASSRGCGTAAARAGGSAEACVLSHRTPFTCCRLSSNLRAQPRPAQWAAPLASRTQHGSTALRTAAGGVHVGSLVAKPDMQFAIVVARFNDLVTKLLLEGAIEAFHRHGVPTDAVQVCVPPFWTRVIQNRVGKGSTPNITVEIV